MDTRLYSNNYPQTEHPDLFFLYPGIRLMFPHVQKQNIGNRNIYIFIQYYDTIFSLVYVDTLEWTV